MQKAADDAKAAQQKVEIELAIQRKTAAKAERDLIEVRKRQEPRQLFASDVEKIQGISNWQTKISGDDFLHIRRTEKAVHSQDKSETFWFPLDGT